VSVLPCEHTYREAQHYKALQYFVVTAMKIHGNKSDRILLAVSIAGFPSDSSLIITMTTRADTFPKVSWLHVV